MGENSRLTNCRAQNHSSKSQMMSFGWHLHAVELELCHPWLSTRLKTADQAEQSLHLPSICLLYILGRMRGCRTQYTLTDSAWGFEGQTVCRPVLTVKRFQETCAATRHATNLPRRSVEWGNCPILCVKITLSVTISLNQDKNRNSISEQAHLPGHKNHMSDPIPEIQAAYNGKKRAALS